MNFFEIFFSFLEHEFKQTNCIVIRTKKESIHIVNFITPEKGIFCARTCPYMSYSENTLFLLGSSSRHLSIVSIIKNPRLTIESSRRTLHLILDARGRGNWEGRCHYNMAFKAIDLVDSEPNLRNKYSLSDI